jgi:hypothetical protein
MRPVWSSSQFQASQQVDDLASGLENAVRKPIVSRRIRWQEDETEVFGHDEIAGSILARLVHQHDECTSGATACPSSARKRFIAAVSSRVITKAHGCRGRDIRPDYSG